MKLPFYARARVDHAWLVDPVAHTVEVFARDAEGWRLALTAGGAGEVKLPPFDAVPLSLDLLWPA